MNARLLDTFTGRVRLEGLLSTRTGLHIGAGSSRDPLATDAPVVRTAAGTPFIPGSSLKGVIRSAAEALLRGANKREANKRDAAPLELWACDQIGGRGCVDHEKIDELREQCENHVGEVDERAVAEQVWQASCTVCRLFGSLALASRVRFPDLLVAGEAPLTEIRNGVGIDRDKELAAQGVLYDFEAVPPETRFNLTLILDNAEEWEVGLLLFLFDELDDGSLAIGGKTSRGLGQVRIDWQRIIETRLQPENPFARLLSSCDLLAAADQPDQPEPPAPAAIERNLPTSGDPEAWKILAEVLEAMPEVDKNKLGEAASARGLRRDSLNDKLGLGLSGKRVRKVWDTVLQRLSECGYLVAHGDKLFVAGQEPVAETAAAAPSGPEPLLQAALDRFVGATARRWEEVFDV